ncbi:hypothetical protein FNV43_RR13986 [Rhamnella rubrinervis]|uniref:Bifunctional inhibitor/plant lipid transfer protein/seed storage helical domain-containing protein n=1 Tax=Rhamnella rubrinervis TaxID=2594499 RepID=A0A8K0H220_9ROSA|nr:hypothetical protein FNV43_RR13986 [Rhamnella rubrinervis]
MAVAAQLCSPLEMEPCKPAIATVTPPSSICCRNVREQRPCYCEYLKDPNLDVNTPRFRRVAATCGVLCSHDFVSRETSRIGGSNDLQSEGARHLHSGDRNVDSVAGDLLPEAEGAETVFLPAPDGSKPWARHQFSRR